MIKNCLYCGKEFKTQECFVKRGGGKFCSRPCTGKGRYNPSYKHGNSIKTKVTKEYGTWQSMLHRTRSKKAINWENYGARGIKVCDRWLDFRNFIDDMGKAPSPKHSIDRIDVNGDYEPNNCRWATPKEQNNNKTNNKLLTYDGKTMNLTQWSERLGIDRMLVGNRLRRGWSVEKALTSPKLTNQYK